MKTKQLIIELQALVNTFGYWSKEVQDFNSSLDFSTMNKINQSIKR